MASVSRLILFDQRGTGLSERDVGDSTLEERMDDLRAVLAAAGSDLKKFEIASSPNKMANTVISLGLVRSTAVVMVFPSSPPSIRTAVLGC
jgi:hypothetical protein